MKPPLFHLNSANPDKANNQLGREQKFEHNKNRKIGMKNK